MGAAATVPPSASSPSASFWWPRHDGGRGEELVPSRSHQPRRAAAILLPGFPSVALAPGKPHLFLIQPIFLLFYLQSTLLYPKSHDSFLRICRERILQTLLGKIESSWLSKAIGCDLRFLLKRSSLDSLIFELKKARSQGLNHDLEDDTGNSQQRRSRAFCYGWRVTFMW